MEIVQKLHEWKMYVANVAMNVQISREMRQIYS